MMTRIRYKTVGTTMTNVTPLFAKTMMLKAEIDLIKMRYVIYDDSKELVVGADCSSKQKLLNEVKIEVKKQGVLFHDEVRPRKTRSKKQDDINLNEAMKTDEWGVGQ